MKWIVGAWQSMTSDAGRIALSLIVAAAMVAAMYFGVWPLLAGWLGQ